jgi:hypothetical protein
LKGKTNRAALIITLFSPKILQVNEITELENLKAEVGTVNNN